MKYLMMLIFSFLCCNPLFAQVLSPDKMMATSSDIKGKLVELAFQNPELEIADHQINVAKYQLKSAKGWWADNISLAFNANEYSLKRLGKKPDVTTGQYTPFYPLYNVGVNIPIGGILTKPAMVRAAKERVAIAQAQRNSTYNQIKAAVLTAYEDYLASKQLLTLQSQVTESTYSEFLQAKEKFRNGQILLDDYNTATQAYHSQQVSKITAQHNFNLTKIQLESLIGVPLDGVLNNGGSAIPTDSTRTP